MLTQIGDGVFVRQSAFCLSNAVVVVGKDGALLIDPGVSGADPAPRWGTADCAATSRVSRPETRSIWWA